MKKNVLKISKIYVITLICFITLSAIYAAIINNSNEVNQIYPRIIIGGFTFLTLGFLAANFHQKKGLLTALMYSSIFILIMTVALFLIGLELSLMLGVRYLIFLSFALFGGTLGVHVKKMV